MELEEAEASLAKEITDVVGTALDTMNSPTARAYKLIFDFRLYRSADYRWKPLLVLVVCQPFAELPLVLVAVLVVAVASTFECVVG